MAKTFIQRSKPTPDPFPDYVTSRSAEDADDDQPFTLIAADVFAEREPPGYLIDDILPANAEIKFVGDAGSGKSFAALDMAASIAAGLPWLGAYTIIKPGPVVYVVAEGEGGFSLRVRAWRKFHNISGRIPLYLLPARPQFAGREGPQVSKLLRVIAALPQPPVLIVVDTQARAMEGKDENNPRDLGDFLAAVSRIREETGASVAVVHHTGWDGNRERGHSSQRGAADMVMLFEADKDNPHHINASFIKQKEDDLHKPIPLKLTKIDLGKNDKGKPIDSAVLEFHAKAGPSPVDLFPLGSTKRRLLRWVVKAGPEGKPHRDLLALAEEKGITERTFERWLQWLALRGYIQRPSDRRRGSYTALEKGQNAYKRLRAKKVEARKAKQ